MTDLLAAALDYAAHGVYVFPARVTLTRVDDVDTKRVEPVGRWRNVSTRDVAVIKDWFGPGRPWAEASLCIDCGKSALVVVDLDEGPRKAGLANWAELILEHGIEVTPIRVRTPGGGEHWYYREHRRHIVSIDSSGKVGQDVDVRGLGGFVFAWPSTDPRGGYGRVDLEALAEAPVVPDFVIERMNARAEPAPAVVAAPGTVAPPDDFWRSVAPPRTFTVEAARKFVTDPLEVFRGLRTPEDSGFNAKLNALACIWSHFVPEFMSAATAEEHLYAAAVDNRSVEWQGEQGVRATIRSGLNQTRDTWKATKIEPGDVVAQVADDRFKPLDWHALWGDDTPEEWIIQPILPARRGVALYSPPKIGKSLLTLEIVVAIAMGGHALGTQVERPYRVLYVDFENDPKGDIRPRLQDMGYGPDDLANLIYLSFPPLSPLDTAIGAAELLEIVQLHAAEVVVIDTVSRSVKGEENENDTWLAFYRFLGRELKSRGVAMLRLDHTGKDETKGQRGGSAKSGDVDMVWRMSKVAETVFRLDCEAHRMPVLEPMLTLHRETEPRLFHRVDATGRAGAWRAALAEAMAVLEAGALPLDAGREPARAMLRTAGVKISNTLLSEALKERRRLMNVSADLSGTGAENDDLQGLSRPGPDRLGQAGDQRAITAGQRAVSLSRTGWDSPRAPNLRTPVRPPAAL